MVKSQKQTPGAGEVAQRVNTLATQTSWPEYDPWTHIRKLDVIARICNPSTPAGKQKAETRESPGSWWVSYPGAGGSATPEDAAGHKQPKDRLNKVEKESRLSKAVLWSPHTHCGTSAATCTHTHHALMHTPCTHTNTSCTYICHTHTLTSCTHIHTQ